MPRQPSRPQSPWRFVGADLPTRLALAQDPATDAETLTVVAPPARDSRRDPALTALVTAVLRHPGCPPAVAARYVGHPDVAVRRLVLTVGDLSGTALQALSYDPDAQIRSEAVARLTGG